MCVYLLAQKAVFAHGFSRSVRGLETMRLREKVARKAFLTVFGLGWLSVCAVAIPAIWVLSHTKTGRKAQEQAGP